MTPAIGGEADAGVIASRISSLTGRPFPSQRITVEAEAAAWSRTTHNTRWSAKVIVRPQAADDVGAIVKVLRAIGDVGAISRGRNIGLGERLGQSPADCIVDLGDLRAIVAYNPLLGLITIEPGVSFAEVDAFLQQRDSPFFLPAIGGPSDASVIGNALQRGDGIGPGPSPSLLQLDAILGDGERFATNQRDKASGLIGPDHTGLFFQSGLGLVTRATFALVRLPDALLSYCIRFNSVHQMPVVIDVLRECMAQGIIPPRCASLWSEGKIAARLGLDPPKGRSVWCLSGAFYAASTARAEVDWRDLVERLSGAGIAFTVLQHALQTKPYARTLYTGHPSDDNLGQVTYGLPAGGDHAQRTGFAWLCPAIPFDGATTLAALSLVFDALKAAAIHENVALLLHSARELRGFIALGWDRSEPMRDNAAHACHDALLADLIKMGCLPFRVGHLSHTIAAHAAGEGKMARDLMTRALGAV